MSLFGIGIFTNKGTPSPNTCPGQRPGVPAARVVMVAGMAAFILIQHHLRYDPVDRHSARQILAVKPVPKNEKRARPLFWFLRRPPERPEIIRHTISPRVQITKRQIGRSQAASSALPVELTPFLG